MQTGIRNRLLLVLASMVLAALLGPAPASATFPGENGKIGFIGGGGISSINLDGSGTTNLVNSRANFIWQSLAWSPDGIKIAFVSDDDGMDNYYDIYTVNADGNGFTNVSAHSGPGWSPSWSPDGSKLVHANGIVYTVNADGSDLKGLTDGDGSVDAMWSPNGSRIAFARNGDIYAMNTDGSGQTRLTDTIDSDGWPAWSPDESKIAFVRGKADCRGPGGDYLSWPDSAACYAIFVMNADGTAQTRLTRGHARPSWSPDGSKIAFLSYRDGQHLYTISPDGSGETILAHGGPTLNDSVDWFDWSPDSSKLVFQRNGSINLIDASGGGETFLTTGATPAWQPVVLSAFKNARKFCRAQREAQGRAAFKERYGRRAFRQCITQAGRP